MKKMLKVFAFCSITLFTNVTALAAGTADEATAMVKKAVAHLKAQGKDKAFADFSNSKEFKNDDLYIFVTDMSGKMQAHGTNPKLVGKDLISLKDADGKFFVKSYIELAKSKGSGWVDYKWINPSNSAIQTKSTYVEKVDDLIIGCGIYKQ